MKNISCVKELSSCEACKLKGFFCYTPHEGDFKTCPCCGKYDFLNNYAYNNTAYNVNLRGTSTQYDFLHEDEFENDMRYAYNYSYCNNCNIIFQVGCIHRHVEYDDNIYNCHFIKKWKHKVTNIEYEGMSMFDDEDDWFNNANNVEVLQMYCPHNNNKCTKSFNDNNFECSLVKFEK